MDKKKSLDSEYFKDVYSANEDPWNFETSAYEAAKYTVTLEALPRKQYINALEIGCSIGVLTELLAARCSHLTATDVSQIALKKAADRCKNLEHVIFRQLSFPQKIPTDNFDLIMLSEVAYYLSPEDWKMGMQKLYSVMTSTAHLVMVHWLPEVHDYPQTGDEVHDSFSAEMQNKMKNIFNTREEKYRIDIWKKLP